MAFANKVVLITGGSAGIGAATAIEFAKEDARVAIVGRNVTKLEKVAADCTAVGKPPLIIKADLANAEEVSTIVKKTIDAFGRLDVLVNNAGMGTPASFFEGNLMESFDITMATNLRAVLQLTSLAVPHLIETKGNIINISSIAGVLTSKNASFMTYAMSKAALNHFTRCAASELAPHGVRVNTISPGPVRTDILQTAGYDITWADFEKATPLKRVGEPVEIAELILFLASDKARSITGSDYVSDNGSCLGYN